MTPNAKSPEVAPAPRIDIHAALQRAASPGVKLQTTSVKLNPVVKEIAGQICGVQGKTVSSFCNACLEILVEDYLGPKEFARLKAQSPGGGDAAE
jgi:hypothetical protein